MPLPEIPESWFRLIQTVLLSVVTVLTVLGYNKADSADKKADEAKGDRLILAQKVDATAAKVDHAKEVTSNDLKVIGMKTDRLDAKIK